VIAGMEELRWSIRCDRGQMVTAVRVPAATESWAYICKEANRYDLPFFLALGVVNFSNDSECQPPVEGHSQGRQSRGWHVVCLPAVPSADTRDPDMSSEKR